MIPPNPGCSLMVSELISELKMFPPDIQVEMDGYDDVAWAFSVILVKDKPSDYVRIMREP